MAVAKPKAKQKAGKKRVVKTGLTKEQEAAVAANDAILQLTAEDFEPLVGQVFEARPCTVDPDHIDALAPVHLTLEQLVQEPETPEEHRDPFTMVFSTQDSLPAQSALYRISHKKLGAHDLLVEESQAPEDNPTCTRYVHICFG